ncbi:DUF2147 domain-containing protein [Paragemmobacter straminiformis]|uniref:DUF2147 domain-containing protein n=1 Tax=Paragemmobacter straminiformis TaxID=2045119 RepID=A0A842I332_9RHOB|nr:DUF2147 domain-containing protein [Gemmobacter straminiformis]MBC2833883.1 DUF2147 domain-containing protein [Gemmobacter straminiformis]
MRVLGAGIAVWLMAGAAYATDPVEGVWQTIPDDNGHYGHIEVKPCGAAFCGVLVRAFDETGAAIDDAPEIGKQIIWDMVAEGGGFYDGGKVWSPDRDKVYASKMTLTGDSLAVEGCVLFICRDGGTWTRVK